MDTDLTTRLRGMTLAEEEAEMVDALRAAGHEPKLDEDGEVDWFAMDYDPQDGSTPHNGPMCAKCGDSWCQACWAMGREPIKPCKGTKG